MSPLELSPGISVVNLAVALIEWRFVDNDALPCTAGQRVIGYSALDSLLIASPLPLRGRQSVFLVTIEIHDATVAVVPRVALIVPQNRKLDAVDTTKLLDCKAQLHAHEDVYLYQRLPTFVIRAQCTVPRPLRSKLPEMVIWESSIIFGPPFPEKLLIPALYPEIGIVRRHAAQHQYSKT